MQRSHASTPLTPPTPSTPALGHDSPTATVRLVGCAITSDQCVSSENVFGSLDCVVGLVESLDNADAPPHGFDTSFVGSRVVVPTGVPCASCSVCSSGLSAHCPSPTRVVDTASGLMPRTITAPARSCVRLPKNITSSHAGLAALSAHAMRIVAELPLGDTAYVSIIGSCARTVLCAQALRLSCELTRVVTPVHPASTLVGSACDQLGIKHRPAADIGRRADQHAVVECSGTRAGFNLACELVQPRATVVLARPVGIEHLDLALAMQKELRIIASRTGSLSQGIIELARGSIDAAQVMGTRTAAERIDDAADSVRSGWALACDVSFE